MKLEDSAPDVTAECSETPSARDARPAGSETPSARDARPADSETPSAGDARPADSETPSARDTRPADSETHQLQASAPSFARFSWYSQISRAVILFALFSFAGWLYETIENVFTFGGLYLRAQLMLPWCPIYGIGGLVIVAVLEPVRKRLQARIPMAVQIVVIAIGVYALTSAVELAGSYACEQAMGYVPWDYSHAWGNFQGRIAPAYTLRFVVLGLIALYVLFPVVTRFVAAKPRVVGVIAITLAVLLAGDYALQTAGVWNPVKDSLVQYGVNHW